MCRPTQEQDVTQLLRSVRNGDKDAEARLVSAVYHELHAIADRLMRNERHGHTLQPTALVNEAYVRLVSQGETDWQDRRHFFATAAQVMRHILVDWARRRLAGKRGGRTGLTSLDDAMVVAPQRLEDLLVLEEAVQKLEVEEPRVCQVFVLRFYGGLDVDEVAAIVQVSPRTVKRDWNYGRAWLKSELQPRTRHAARQPGSC